MRLFYITKSIKIMEYRRGAYRVWCGDLRERDHLKDVDVDGRIILKRIFKKGDERGMYWIDLALHMGTVTSFCYCGNEPFGSIK